jgi:hypothetical protein
LPEPTTPPADERLCVKQEDIAAVAGVSAKTLERLAKKGESVGRLKLGRAVVFHLPTLNAWLTARAAPAIAAPAITTA